MSYKPEKFEKMVTLIDRHSTQEGVNYSKVEGFGTFRSSTTQVREPALDLSAIWIIGQGQKVCYLEDQKYVYSPGNVVVMLYPLVVETEILEATPEAPLLVTGVAIDLARLADVVLKIDRIDGTAVKPVATSSSSVFSFPLDDKLIDAVIRMLECLDDPRDAAMLGDSIIEEIYYRLLTGERGGELRFLLQQRGEVQRISKAVNYIHSNMDKPVSVEQLAEMVYMSRTSFYENFKDVMHQSPLQYAKSVKLHKAQTLIQEGRKANEAGYMVGYNSPAQFSREYKRYFGYSPSAT